jgi:hypothetical protein
MYLHSYIERLLLQFTLTSLFPFLSLCNIFLERERELGFDEAFNTGDIWRDLDGSQTMIIITYAQIAPGAVLPTPSFVTTTTTV